VPFVELASSPLAKHGGPARIFYRRYGPGFPLVFLHGGWGYSVYPFGKQIDALGRDFGIVIPDRSGYGQSGQLDTLPLDFHRRAAGETLALLDALHVEKAVLWGHSDGSVIAAMLGLENPERFPAIILEAFHYLRSKPLSSQGFFENMLRDPESVGPRVVETLKAEHGDKYWKHVLRMNGEAWLALARDARPTPDLYGGRLHELKTAVLVMQGARDPRTEPGENAAVDLELPRAVQLVENGGHSPHSESAVAEATCQMATKFLAKVNTWVRM